MRKISVLVCSFLLATLISILAVSPAQANIEPFAWQPPYTFKGYDYWFYEGQRIVGYEHGTTASLKIPVEGTFSPYMNVTEVSLVFDTGLNITLNYTATPVEIAHDEIHFFDVSFTVNVTETSNVWAHTYTIYVKYNYPSTGTWSADWNDWSPSFKFVVYSVDQVEVMDLAVEYYATETDWYNFESAAAQSLAQRAIVEGSMGDTYLSRWDFAEAETHFQNALDLYDQAFAAEKVWGTTYQGAQLNATKIEADAALISANAAMNQSYAWVLLGLGFLIIGIGVLVYAFKKPKAA